MPAPGVRARVVKVFLDGVVNAPADTGALLTPYLRTSAPRPRRSGWQSTNLGQQYYTPASLQALMLATVDAGLDMHLHATGDRGVRTVLDAVAATRQARPGADFRPAIAHDETVAVADYGRFAALDVMATMSFQWAQRAPYSIGETESHLGAERFARMEPSGSLQLAGARIVHGSDWPIDPFDTFLALKIGVTRAGDPTNPHSAASFAPIFEGPINADPALSRDAVLAAITVNAAHQLRLERQIGSDRDRQVRRPDRARARLPHRARRGTRPQPRAADDGGRRGRRRARRLRRHGGAAARGDQRPGPRAEPARLDRPCDPGERAGRAARPRRRAQPLSRRRGRARLPIIAGCIDS